MGIIESYFEKYEIITPKGEPYGVLMGEIISIEHFVPYFVTFNQTLNRFDTLRCVRDGKVIRITSEPRIMQAPEGVSAPMFCFFQEYRLFESDDI